MHSHLLFVYCYCCCYCFGGGGGRVTRSKTHERLNMWEGLELEPMMFQFLRVLTLLLALEVVHDGTCVQICEKYPSPDPCQPGGVWDPVLNRLIAT